MNYIFIVLFIGTFIYLASLKKLILREQLKKQITDSMLEGLFDYFSITFEKAYLKNKQFEEIKENEFDELRKDRLLLYKSMVDGLEDYIDEKKLENFTSGKNFNLFVDRPNLGGHTAYRCEEPANDRYQLVVLLSLYNRKETREKAMKIAESVPMSIKQKFHTLIGYKNYNEVMGV